SVGLFGIGTINDGNPNPIDYLLAWGISGTGVLRCREHDSFGLSFFYAGLSAPYKTVVQVQTGFAQSDVRGGEFFYTLALTPWFRVTGNLQVVDPSTKGVPTVTSVGVRGLLNF